MNTLIFRPITAWVSIAMSLAALSVIAFHIATVGTAPQADEGAAAHLWQLLIAGQVPLLIYHAIRWLPGAPKQAMAVIGVQIVAVAAAILPVYLLRW